MEVNDLISIAVHLKNHSVPVLLNFKHNHQHLSSGPEKMLESDVNFLND